MDDDDNADGNNKKRSFGIGKLGKSIKFSGFGKLRKGINFSSFSECGKIGAKYKVLPPAKYQIYLIFGEFDNIHDEEVQKIAITTDDRGNFKWNFNTMVVKNENVELKDNQEVTVMLCKDEDKGCYVFQKYGNYAKMKTQMAETDNRFYEYFQVQYENPVLSNDSEDLDDESPSEEEESDEQLHSPNHQGKDDPEPEDDEEEDDDDDVGSPKN
uniref:NPL domain-containing protein n=1 Tax=Globodera pallida TaxID=36090 RepID=A0A183C6L1_GLOPA